MGLDDNSQFTIRSKVLIALISLPLFVLTILLYFSLKTIENDKIAYVFETASSLTSSLGSQIDQQLSQSIDKTEELSSLFDPIQDNWTIQAQDFFKKNSALEAILIFNPKNQLNTRPHQFSQYFEKEKGLTYQVLQLKNLSQTLASRPQSLRQKNELPLFHCTSSSRTL